MRLPFLVSLPSVPLLFFSFLAANVRTSLAIEYVTYTNSDGKTVYLDSNREPSLYTRDFGDCQGDSIVTIDRFDAAYYKDNMTITFHLEGSTAIANESVILYIGVYAYGENRFNLTFDPCFANIRSMCPINASVPIAGNGVIPIAPADVAGISDIALSIPDFEGQAILRVFGNSTQSQIACYSAVLTNGNTFSHPTAVGSTVGFFVAIAFISSIATAIYAQGLQETRKHYAHSLSIFVVFSVLQHVFYTGALSMNFPSVLVAFWSNFGWASGMIYNRSMQNAINKIVGNNLASISDLGSAVSGENAVNLGGGYTLSSIYRRSLEERDIVNSTSAFTWYGNLVKPGLPLPGNYSSFAGTLGELHIPVSNAFLTGLIWFLILVAILVAAIALLKSAVELLAAAKVLKTDRLWFFRRHWIYCAGIVVLRAFFIAFFMLTFLALFQFTIGGESSVIAVAAVVFCLCLVVMLGLSTYALWYRLNGQELHNDPDHLQLKSRTVGHIPWYGWTRESTALALEDSRKTVMSLPCRNINLKDSLERPHAHDDDDYLIKFGWLSARFRRSKWWFFAAWLIYELVRACFYGAAAGSPLIQVFGLLAWEILALFAIVAMKPFESNRLNTLMVYFLGFSKVTSVALCSAFDPRFGLPRILTTVIGVVIIVIQGVLIICTLIAVVVGAISSWMSVRRYKENFHPSRLANKRTKYFAHLDHKATDKPRVKATSVIIPEVMNEPKEPYFEVKTIRRETKIEDDDIKNEHKLDEVDVETVSENVVSTLPNRQSSRAPSMRSRSSISNLPYGARRHRASWSNRDFSDFGYETEHIPSGIQSRMSTDSFRDPIRETAGTPMRKRGSSVRHSWANDASLSEVANAALDQPPNSYRVRPSTSNATSQTQMRSIYLAEEDPVEVRPTTRA